MSGEARPSPSALLRRLQHEEQESKRTSGRLKIFLGSAAGVGKTYQMLEEAQSLKEQGQDVVVALVETHERKETEDLLQSLEIIPRREIEHQGITLSELDLEAVLARHPAIALLDELAHSNAPGMRHDKRFQDAEELLSAGISVYTTLNIQHIESLNDVVYQITGVKVRETVPDRILELADQLELVDLPPEELLRRFKEGKVYVPPQAEQAMSRFFRMGNLLGLRELALRYTARHAEGEMLSYMEMHEILGPWPAGSRILVCISDSSLSTQLVRIGQRMAAEMDAQWFAVHVESPQDASFGEAARDQLQVNLQLAEELGAKVEVLSGHNTADELMIFAKAHNITLIVVGLPRKRRRVNFWRGSVVNELILRSGAIHVLVIGSTAELQPGLKMLPALTKYDWSKYDWRAFLGSSMSVAATVAVCWLIKDWLEFVNIAMILLLPVVYSGTMWGRRAGLVSSLLAVASLDFFFVPPVFTFSVADLRYLPIFFVFAIVAIVTSLLAELVRWQGESARQREKFISALYTFSRDLMGARTSEELLSLITKSISEAFDCDVRIFLPNRYGQLQVVAPERDSGIAEERELGIATWVFQRGLKAGRGTDTLSSTTWSYLPLKANETIAGVLGVNLRRSSQHFQSDQRQLMDSFANIIALSLSRIKHFQDLLPQDREESPPV
jgi:two-component system sensor histidine kinase KdpD